MQHPEVPCNASADAAPFVTRGEKGCLSWHIWCEILFLWELLESQRRFEGTYWSLTTRVLFFWSIFMNKSKEYQRFEIDSLVLNLRGPQALITCCLRVSVSSESCSEIPEPASRAALCRKSRKLCGVCVQGLRLLVNLASRFLWYVNAEM